jgi:hypothetical protein
LTPFYAALTRRPRLSYTLTTDSKSTIEKEGNFMRKPILIAAGAAAALATAAVAVAATFTAGGITTTSATTFKATQPTDVKTRTCTGGDGKQFTITDARYTGTAVFTNPGAPNNVFDGPLAIHARTTVDMSSHLGVVEGDFKINNGDNRLSGRFVGTLDANGALAGFLTGKSHGNKATVLGTLGGTFTTAAGLDAKLGSGASVTPAALLVGPVCKGKPEPPKPAPKPKRFHIEGTLAINGTPTPTSVTVTGKGPTTATCSFDGGSPGLTGFAAGDRVEMACEGVVNNNVTTWYLRELKKHH